jgi:hypothetical protein
MMPAVAFRAGSIVLTDLTSPWQFERSIYIALENNAVSPLRSQGIFIIVIPRWALPVPGKRDRSGEEAGGWVIRNLTRGEPYL